MGKLAFKLCPLGFIFTFAALAPIDLCGQDVAPRGAGLGEPLPAIRTLNDSARAEMERGAYDRATALADSARALAESRGELGGLAHALNTLGVIHRRTGSFPGALEYFGRSLSIQRQRGDQQAIATALHDLAVVYGFDLGEYDRALERQLESLTLREELGEEEGIAESHGNLGVIYDNLGDDESAVRHLQTALAAWRELDRPSRVASTLTGLAWVVSDPESERHDLDRALSLETEALEIREEIGSPVWIAQSLWSLGHIHTLAGRYDLADRHLQRSLALREEAGDRRAMASTLVTLAMLDRLRGRLSSSMRRARAAEDAAAELDARTILRDARIELSLALEEGGDPAGALRAFRAATELDDELFDESSARRAELLRNERDLARAEREIEQLQSQSRIRDAEANRRDALVAAGALLLLVVFLLYRRQVQTVRLKHELEVRTELETLVKERTGELERANARLAELSLTDTLTGLRNRRYLQQTLSDHVGAATRVYQDAVHSGVDPTPGSDIVFYLIDLDHFKSVNDEFGHAMGDLVLAQTAKLLRCMCRASDTVLRWGGEEFLVVSRHANRVYAEMFAERVRKTFGEYVFMSEGRELKRTCSIGFAAFPFVPNEPDSLTWEQTVHLADLALYEAKNNGRNRWVGVKATPKSRSDEITRVSDSTDGLDDMAALGQVMVMGSVASA